MPLHVCNGATLACTFGLAPGTLTVPPLERVLTGGQPAATVMDHRPQVNVSPFGLCASPANPQVIAATAAALGVLTPQPCVPMTLAPWMPGAPTVLLGGKPALDDTCRLACLWGGVVQTTFAGQLTQRIP